MLSPQYFDLTYIDGVVNHYWDGIGTGGSELNDLLTLAGCRWLGDRKLKRTSRKSKGAEIPFFCDRLTLGGARLVRMRVRGLSGNRARSIQVLDPAPSKV